MQESYKDKKKGRSAGGMITGIRKNMKVKKLNKGSRDIISIDVEIEGEDWRIMSVYNRAGKKEYLKNTGRRNRKRRMEEADIGRRLQRENGRARKHYLERR